MKQKANMKLWIMIGIPLLGLACGGCGKPNSEKANARAAETAKVTTKWKHDPESAAGGTYGLIIESEGGTITAASMYELKEDASFEIVKKLSNGHTVSKERELLLPLAAPLPTFGMSAGDWIANGGPYWIVWYVPGATNVTATLNTPGVNKYRFTFVPVIDGSAGE